VKWFHIRYKTPGGAPKEALVKAFDHDRALTKLYMQLAESWPAGGSPVVEWFDCRLYGGLVIE